MGGRNRAAGGGARQHTKPVVLAGTLGVFGALCCQLVTGGQQLWPAVTLPAVPASVSGGVALAAVHTTRVDICQHVCTPLCAGSVWQ
jgi:hypothetical protein